jgi:hypothetical protein
VIKSFSDLLVSATINLEQWICKTKFIFRRVCMKKFLKKQLGVVSLALLLVGVLVLSGLINAVATDGLFDAGPSTGLSDGGGLPDNKGLSEDAYLDGGGEGPFMMVMSGSAAVSNLTINAVAGKQYDISIAASDITSFSGMTVTMQYDPARMQLSDLCAFTKAKELSAGAIPGIGVTVSQVSNGAIVLTVSKSIPSGNVWSGVINTISLKALQSGNTAVTATENNTKVAAPTASPAPGTYNTTQNVALSCTTAGATIRYTTNGTEPTSSSMQYSTPISVSATTTIKAKAFMSGLADSDTGSFTYTIQAKAATPTASPAPGTYSATQSVTLSCATSGATIRYTTNGTEPTSSSTQYSTPISVSATTTIKAKAFMSGLADSDTASFTYTIGGSVYSLGFFRYIWGDFEPCDWYVIDVNSTDTVYIYAFVLDGQGDIVSGPEVVSVVYVADSGAQNTTGEFTLDDLEIDVWGWYYPTNTTYVTAIATLSNGTILQEQALVEAMAIQPGAKR